MAKANGETDKRVRSIQRQFNSLSASAKSMESRMVGSFGVVGRAFGVLGIALTTTSIIQMTSAWTDLNSRVNNAAGSLERGAAVLGRLSDMARRTYSSLEQTAEGYLQNQQALSALGYSTQQQLDLVETLNNSLVISAVRGDRARSVMDAWSKAMAGGKLSGDDLNTIIQSGGRLSKALADSMGVSVNELRRLGSEGKITTDVMFGVTSQLEQLRIEADNMPATVSDGFVLLRDAVFNFIGQADAAVGSSNRLAEAIIRIADAINNLPESKGWDRFWGFMGDSLAQFVEEGEREIGFISNVIDALSQKDPAEVFVKLNAALGGNVRTAQDFELALADAEQAVANLAANTAGRFGTAVAETENGVVTLGEAVQDLFQQALEGKGSAEAAEEAIRALGSVGDPEFADLQAVISSVIGNLYAMRDAATAARAAVANATTDLGAMPSWRQFNKDLGPDLSTDGRPGGPIRPPTQGGGGSRGGGGGRSSADRYGDELSRWRDRTAELEKMTAVQRALNPLVNDYGYALEKAKAQLELENAATKAGIALSPERRAEIEGLAEAYAVATAEAAKLAEAQGANVKQMEALRDAAQNALQTMIDGFLEGKSAGEIFANVLSDIGKELISMGMNNIFGSGSGGFGIFGQLFGKGFSKGGYTGAGGVRQPAGVVHKGEVVWSQRDIARAGGVGVVEAMRRGARGYADGGIVSMPPMPAMPSSSRGDSGPSFTFAPTIDARGADVAAVARLERVVAKQQAEFTGRVKEIVRTRGHKW
ncbi:tape measure protein [Devosia crocina]|uniref:tape measure protein n=1 Tax=Devosia crocina TaxID=429728 RepID=UPI001587507C|nr:tape measure protein [Devosia crocina]